MARQSAASVVSALLNLFKSVPAERLDQISQDLNDSIKIGADLWTDPHQTPTARQLGTSSTALSASGSGASAASQRFSQGAHVGDGNDENAAALAQLLGEVADLKKNQSAMASLLLQMAKADGFAEDDDDETSKADENTADGDDDEAQKSLRDAVPIPMQMADMMTNMAGKMRKAAKAPPAKEPLRRPPDFNAFAKSNVASALDLAIEEAESANVANTLSTIKARLTAASRGTLRWDMVMFGVNQDQVPHEVLEIVAPLAR
jgi:hypothetical protein